MAYHGYIPLIHEFLKEFETPKVLEIGVWTGVTTFSLLHRLSITHKKFEYTGIDVNIRADVVETLKYMGIPTQCYSLIEENSLEQLDKMSGKFDVILIDGDHNYPTVKRELQKIIDFCHNETMIICDDYHGKWSDKDLYYGEREEYAQNFKTTQRIDEGKQGVRPAVDEFLEAHPNWFGITFVKGEPLVLLCKESKFIEMR